MLLLTCYARREIRSLPLWVLEIQSSSELALVTLPHLNPILFFNSQHPSPSKSALRQRSSKMEAPQDHDREEPSTPRRLRRLLKAHSRIYRPRTPDSDEDYYHQAPGWGDFRIRQAKEAFRILMGNDLTESFKEDDEANTYAKKGVALFFVESTPAPVHEESACQVWYCDEKIAAGGYRVALYPRLLCGSRGRTGGAGKTYLNVLRVALTSSIDYYHVECFEQLVDFWDSQYYQRLLPTLDGFWGLRGLSKTLNDYYLDIGAGILVSEWKMAMVRLMHKRDGVTVDRSSCLYSSVRTSLMLQSL